MLPDQLKYKINTLHKTVMAEVYRALQRQRAPVHIPAKTCPLPPGVPKVEIGLLASVLKTGSTW